MKKLIALICALLMLSTVFVGCDKGETNANNNGNSASTPIATPEPTPTPEAITEKTDYVTEQWIAVDIPFTANSKSRNITDAELDVTFKNRATGTTMLMPGFWDGDDKWVVRFAPTECGIWDYETTTRGEDIGISGIKGTLACNAYSGDLAIYKHGFVKTVKDVRYFVYADNTPFYYLGDTHWNMVTEEYSSAGPNASGIETDSHFKYIVDRRAEQGFTVYQSEPIGAAFNVSDGKISAADIKGFQTYDLYFQYIASKGLVHANAQLLFPSAVTNQFNTNLESLVRYWVARYAAYPVMWTLGQEVDDAKNQSIDMLSLTYINMCALLDKHDPYKNPASAHQLNAASITCKGGVPVAGIDGGYNNYDPEQNNREFGSKTRASAFNGAVGHTWWATQWRPVVDQSTNFGIPRDYWENGEKKPIVDYEGRYHLLYGGDFAARAQAWIAFLCGMYGVAYGGADMWLYKGTYAMDSPAYDGIETISLERKKTTWGQLINAPISNELTYMRGFLESAGWWKLIPDFDDANAFKADKVSNYVCAYDTNEVYVVYLYAKNTESLGTLVNMDNNATYTAQWFDTRTGKYQLISTEIKPVNGEYRIPEKPVADDMVILVTKN